MLLIAVTRERGQPPQIGLPLALRAADDHPVGGEILERAAGGDSGQAERDSGRAC